MLGSSQFSARAVRLAWPLVVTAALLLPSVAWISLDRSVWFWDQSFYGFHSVKLWQTLSREPTKWRTAMETALGDRAAGICWVGQFFVPLGERLGSIDIGLRLSIVATQLATLLFLWAIGRRLKPGADWQVPLSGCLVAASAPLFVAMSHQFLTEPLQTLAVAWIWYLAIAARSLSRLQAFSQLVAASALGMAAKTSTPLYCLLPAIVVLYNLLPRRLEPQPWWKTVVDVSCLAGASGLAWLTYRWYYTNWAATLHHVKEASSSDVAELYGHRDLFWNKLIFWLGLSQNNLFTSQVLGALGVIVVGGLFWAVWLRQRDRQEPRFTGRDVLALAALLQLAAVLAAFSLSVNEEMRYLLPLLPSVAVLAMWGVAQTSARHGWSGWALAAVLLLQWGFVHAVALGRVERPNAMTWWLAPLTRDKSKAREMERLFEQLTADERTAQRCSMLGSDRMWCNGPTFSYLDMKRQRTGKPTVLMQPMPWMCSDGEQAFKAVQNCNALYVVFVMDAQGPGEFYNRASEPLLKIIRSDPQFVQERFDSKEGMLLFRRVQDVH
jgi:hypothetical protein